MTVKDAFIALCFTGSVVLAAYGGWNYILGRINQGNETIKMEQLRAQGYTDYDPEEQLRKIRQEKNKALIMFAAGAAGVYLVIAHVYRKRKNSITITNQIKKEKQL
jgi:hypothetical protein